MPIKKIITIALAGVVLGTGTYFAFGEGNQNTFKGSILATNSVFSCPLAFSQFGNDETYNKNVYNLLFKDISEQCQTPDNIDSLSCEDLTADLATAENNLEKGKIHFTMRKKQCNVCDTLKLRETGLTTNSFAEKSVAAAKKSIRSEMESSACL